MISGRVTGRGSLERMKDEIYMIEASHELWVEAVGLAAKQYVVQRINTDFPQYAPHFEVVLIPNPEMVIIEVRPIDDIGTYLYRGTEPHMIYGDSMPIAPDAFSQAVSHPGTQSIKPDLDNIVEEAIAISEMSVFI